MTYQDFVNKTGFKPLPDEFIEIDSEYIHSGADADQFYEMWLADGKLLKYANERGKKIIEMEAEINELTDKLDRIHDIITSS